MIRPMPIVAALVMAALLACRRGESAQATADSAFVRTMIELRRIGADSTMDSTMRDSARKVTLRRHGYTAERLEAAARTMASDPVHAAAVWRKIEEEARPARRLAPVAPVRPSRPATQPPRAAPKAKPGAPPTIQ